ncbi:MAG: hydroxyacid dehydrogenase [Candidatus Competibacteraceae bacterium]|nr:hydroxyacid dehydrogenase [Candidatus Competibacteraceae bacterium]
MKITVFEIEPWECETFRDLNQDHQVRFEEGNLTADNAGQYQDTEIISVFIYSKLTQEALSKLKNLKCIATRSTGFDHIDLDYCKENQITVCYVPTYGENTVAEHVFALLLAISHRLVEAADRTRKGDFSQQGLQGFDLRGKTMGVVGTGNIGRHTLKIAKGFGMEIIASDVEQDQQLARELGFEYLELKELLGRADVVSLHVPGSEATRGLLGEEQIEAIKDGAILINTSRGPVVEVQPLLKALSSGKIAAAGLDVLPEEPVIREEAELLRSVFSREHNLETLLADHVLLRLRNVIITPHSAFNTREAMQRILDTTRENIDAFLAGEPSNVVER